MLYYAISCNNARVIVLWHIVMRFMLVCYDIIMLHHIIEFIVGYIEMYYIILYYTILCDDILYDTVLHLIIRFHTIPHYVTFMLSYYFMLYHILFYMHACIHTYVQLNM